MRDLKDCTRGHWPLGRTLWLGGLIVLLVACVLSSADETVDASALHYSWRHGFALLRVLLNMAALVWWAQCVLRACVHRLGDGKSVLLSGGVFFAMLYVLLQAVVVLGTDAKVMAQNWYDDKTSGRQPLAVVADPVLGRIVANGNITRDSSRLFEQVVRANPELTVVQLESYGGYVDEAMVMARLIRVHGMDTVSMRRCASACTLMFVAGRNRYLGPEARFRFHRAGYKGMPAIEKLEEFDQELARFYSAMGAGPEIAQGALATPHHSFWEPTQGELFSANYATLRWSERPPGM